MSVPAEHSHCCKVTRDVIIRQEGARACDRSLASSQDHLKPIQYATVNLRPSGCRQHNINNKPRSERNPDGPRSSP